MSEKSNRPSKQIVTRTVFLIYLLLLIWTVMFKLAVRSDMLIRARGINLIPFGNITGPRSSANLTEHILNVLIFIPFGAYLAHFRPEKPLRELVLAGLKLSLAFEILQFVFMLGGTDVSDLITNTLGAAIGTAALRLLQKPFPRRAIWIFNGLLLPIEWFAFPVLCFSVFYHILQ